MSKIKPISPRNNDSDRSENGRIDPQTSGEVPSLASHANDAPVIDTDVIDTLIGDLNDYKDEEKEDRIRLLPSLEKRLLNITSQDLQTLDENGNKMLFRLLVGLGSKKAIRFFFEKNPLISKENDNWAEGKFYSTAFIEAAIGGQRDIIELLVTEYQFSTEFKDTNGYTALHHAVKNSRFAVAEFLVENNAKLDIVTKDRLQSTPLDFAIRKKDIKMVILLIDNDARIGDSNGEQLNKNWFASQYNGKRKTEIEGKNKQTLINLSATSEVLLPTTSEVLPSAAPKVLPSTASKITAVPISEIMHSNKAISDYYYLRKMPIVTAIIGISLAFIFLTAVAPAIYFTVGANIVIIPLVLSLITAVVTTATAIIIGKCSSVKEICRAESLCAGKKITGAQYEEVKQKVDILTGIDFSKLIDASDIASGQSI